MSPPPLRGSGSTALDGRPTPATLRACPRSPRCSPEAPAEVARSAPEAVAEAARVWHGSRDRPDAEPTCARHGAPAVAWGPGTPASLACQGPRSLTAGPGAPRAARQDAQAHRLAGSRARRQRRASQSPLRARRLPTGAAGTTWEPCRPAYARLGHSGTLPGLAA